MKTLRHQSSLWFQLLLVFLSAVFLMTAFEAVKEWVADDSMTRWQSHTITIFVAALCATITAFFIRNWASSVDSVLQENIEELRLAASVFKNSADGILITNSNGKIVSVNPAFTEITGYLESEVLGSKPIFLRSDHLESDLFHSLMTTLIQNGSWQGEIWDRKKTGEAILESMTINRITHSNGSLSRYVSVFRDVTAIRKTNDQFRHLAFHDALTGLPNRLLFHERLDHAIKRAKRDRSRLALLFIDLDGFKAINDTHGHDIGDRLLKELANRFDRLLRRGNDTVARYGGDEFLILIENLQDAEQTIDVAAWLVAEISRPVELNDKLRLVIGASAGQAIFPDDASDSGELMRVADRAMYSAKENTKKRQAPTKSGTTEQT